MHSQTRTQNIIIERQRKTTGSHRAKDFKISEKTVFQTENTRDLLRTNVVVTKKNHLNLLMKFDAFEQQNVYTVYIHLYIHLR